MKDESSQDDLLTRAFTLHQQGILNQAESVYRQLYRDQPDDNLAYLLGTLLLQKGEAGQAVELLKPAAERQVHSPDLHNNLGLAYQMLQQIPESSQAFQAAIRANPRFLQAHLNLGRLYVDSGLWKEAGACYQQALNWFPENSEIQQELAVSLVNLQDWKSSIKILKTLYLDSADDSPKKSFWLSQLAFAESQEKNDEEALKWYLELTSYYPDSSELASNIGYLQERLGLIDQAVETLSAAIRLNPHQPEIYNNLGIALRTSHQFDRAYEAFDRAVEIRPEFHLARFNRGMLSLLTGKVLEGWPDYESRLKMTPLPVEFQGIPVWKGENLSGKKLLVYSDQGFGDAIQFVRFLPRIKQQSQAELVLYSSEKLSGLFEQSLMGGLPLADHFTSSLEDLQEVSACFPLLSSGDVLRLTEEDFSFESPYLQARRVKHESKHIEGISQQENKKSGKNPTLKLGLCWRGNRDQGQDHVRSLSLETLLPLSELTGIEWHNLQWDITLEEQAVWPVKLHNPMSKIRSFDETAEFISELDLVLTVDTAVAHLSGALGLKTWTLLAHTPDWRWQIEGETSPWYPEMRLFRQPAWGDWDSVLNSVKQELQTLLDPSCS